MYKYKKTLERKDKERKAVPQYNVDESADQERVDAPREETRSLFGVASASEVTFIGPPLTPF